MVDEFYKSKDYFRKKEIVKENQNIIQQIYELRGKQTTEKREKLFKSQKNYKEKLEKITKKMKVL